MIRLCFLDLIYCCLFDLSEKKHGRSIFFFLLTIILCLRKYEIHGTYIITHFSVDAFMIYVNACNVII